MNYQMPVYNIDDNSNYYVAIPNVNKFNNKFKAYDLVVAYNNDMAELISGWKYEKGILYIPKSAIDNPKNQYETPEGELLAIQLNYAIGDDMDFTKRIPVQILKKDEPVEKTASTASIFDLEKLTVSTGVKRRDDEDISVFLNGQMLPINNEAWTYDKDSGELQIFAMPGVVSSINIVFENQKMLEALKDATVSMVERLAVPVAAAVTQSQMLLFKNTDGEDVVVDVPSWMFVGWRGTYKAKTYWGSNSGGESHKKTLKGWENSIHYLYGGDSSIAGSGEGWLDDDEGRRTYESNFVELWAIASYSAGADLGRLTNDGVITRDMLVEHYVDSGPKDTQKMTIYEWMMQYRNELKLSKFTTINTGSGSGNGIGGANNFALTFPTAGSVITGCKKPAGTEGNLVSDPNAPGYNAGNPDFTFNVTGLGTGDYWYCASCNELVDAAASDGDAGSINGGKPATTYVTCLGIDRNAGYAVFAFTQVRDSKQDATAIYKFKLAESDKGLVKLNKVSQDSQTINGLSQYSLAGAKYQLYINQECTVPATDTSGNSAILTTKADGSSNELEMSVGTYYAKETVPPPGHELSTTVTSVTITKNNIEAHIVPLANGSSHSFTGYRDGANSTIGQTTIFTLSGTNGTRYTGTCRQIGNGMATSGNASVVKRIDNNSKIAKVVYKYGVRWGWWQGDNSHKSANSVLGISYNNTVTLQRLIELACQIDNQGAAAFRQIWQNAGGNMTTIDAMINWYANVDYNAEVVPDNFEMYYVHPADGSQDFAIWNVSSPIGAGPAVINVSDKPILTPPVIEPEKQSSVAGTPYTELLDARFTVKYYNVKTKAQIAGASPVRQWTFKTVKKTVDSKDIAGFDWANDTPVSGDAFYMRDGKRVLPIGWFTVEEAQPPEGYETTDTMYYGQIDADGTIKYYDKAGNEISKMTFVNEPDSGEVTIHKTTDKAALASAYPATGVKFSIYMDAACTTIAQDKFKNNLSDIPLNASTMKTETKTLSPGTYYIKETNVPSYFETPAVKSITLEKGEEKTVEFQNVYLKGQAKIKKTTDYPNFEGEYPATDVKFSIFRDAACTQPAVNTDGTTLSNLALNKSMETAFFEVIPGTYYIKETNLPSYFETPEVKSITVAKGDTKTVEFQNKYKVVELAAKKKSANTIVTNGNPLYNVQGTVLKIYKSQSDAKNDANAVATLTIGADGNSNKVTIIKGTYYIVETQAGPGYMIPNSLKAASGGKQIVCDGPKVIDIE